MASCGELASFALHSFCCYWAKKSRKVPAELSLVDNINKCYCLHMQVFSVSLFWTGAVLCNTVHVIVSGIVFLVLIHGGPEAAPMPPNSLMKSLRYAVTTSFGSICYGSLFTAAIRALRWEVHMPVLVFLLIGPLILSNIWLMFVIWTWLYGKVYLSNIIFQIRGFRSKIGNNECLLCCVDFLFHLVETLVRFFNKYAYVQVSLFLCFLQSLACIIFLSTVTVL